MPTIETNNLSKKYGNLLALDSVSIKVDEGSFFAILGPNGAGKTTLMRILTTQLPPTGGRAAVMGKDVVSEGDAVRKVVCYVPQEMSVWGDVSGYENLLVYAKIYGISNSRKKIDDVLKLMDLSGVAHRLVNTYSGGMIRKLEIACAVMPNPAVLFLDEPTIGLDPGSRKAVWDKIISLKKELGTTVFFSTHYMDEANAYADAIGILNKGRIMKVGSPEELKKTIGGSTIAVELVKAPGQPDINLINRMKGIHSAGWSGGTLRITLESKNEPLNELFGFMIKKKFGITGISSSEPTLDDVFLKYSGTVETKTSLSEIKRMRDRIRKS